MRPSIYAHHPPNMVDRHLSGRSAGSEHALVAVLAGYGYHKVAGLQGLRGGVVALWLLPEYALAIPGPRLGLWASVQCPGNA